MKLGVPAKKQWHSSQELASPFNRMGKTFNRLMVLEYTWDKLVGTKGRFWVLKAVKQGTLYVQVKAAVAKNELTAKRRGLISELNKHFQTPWIKHIEII